MPKKSKKQSSEFSKLLAVILLIICCMILVLVAAYIFGQMNHFNRTANSVSNQLEDLKTQISEIKTTEESKIVKENVEQFDLIHYENSDLGFSIEFPTSWEAVEETIHERSNYTDICFSFGRFCIFSIYKYEGDQVNNVFENANVVYQENDLMFVCDGCCDPDSSIDGGGQFNDLQVERCEEAREIIKTFQILD